MKKNDKIKSFFKGHNSTILHKTKPEDNYIKLKKQKLRRHGDA